MSKSIYSKTDRLKIKKVKKEIESIQLLKNEEIDKIKNTQKQLIDIHGVGYHDLFVQLFKNVKLNDSEYILFKKFYSINFNIFLGPYNSSEYENVLSIEHVNLNIDLTTIQLFKNLINSIVCLSYYSRYHQELKCLFNTVKNKNSMFGLVKHWSESEVQDINVDDVVIISSNPFNKDNKESAFYSEIKDILLSVNTLKLNKHSELSQRVNSLSMFFN